MRECISIHVGQVTNNISNTLLTPKCKEYTYRPCLNDLNFTKCKKKNSWLNKYFVTNDSVRVQLCNWCSTSVQHHETIDFLWRIRIWGFLGLLHSNSAILFLVQRHEIEIWSCRWWDYCCNNCAWSLVYCHVLWQLVTCSMTHSESQA